MGDVEFKGVGGGELRRVNVAGFMELGEAGMVRVGVMCRIGVLGPKVSPVEAAGKGGNVSNQAEMIKAEFWGEREACREDRGFRSSARLMTEWVGYIGLESVWEARKQR